MKNEKIVTMLSLSSLLIFSFFGCKAEETTLNYNFDDDVDEALLTFTN